MQKREQKQEGDFIDVEDYEQFGGQGSSSFRDIVMRQMRRVTDIASNELTAGYTEKKLVGGKMGAFPIEKYHPDKREEYCNAIDVLYDLLLPEANEDKKFVEAYESMEKDEKEFFNTCKDMKNPDERRNTWVREKVKFRRRLFRELSLMLWRLDYLKDQIYSE